MLNVAQTPQCFPEASATFVLPERDPAKSGAPIGSKEGSERDRVVDHGNDRTAALFRGLTRDGPPPRETSGPSGDTPGSQEGNDPVDAEFGRLLDDQLHFLRPRKALQKDQPECGLRHRRPGPGEHRGRFTAAKRNEFSLILSARPVEDSQRMAAPHLQHPDDLMSLFPGETDPALGDLRPRYTKAMEGLRPHQRETGGDAAEDPRSEKHTSELHSQL